MTALSIYISITLCAIAAYYLLFEPLLGQLVEYDASRKMMRLELTNDITNTTIRFSRLNNQEASQMGNRAVQDSLQLRQISSPSPQRGEDLILFIERWLLLDAYARKTTYTFYGHKEIYKDPIGFQEQIDVMEWVKLVLRSEPRHIGLELSRLGNHILLTISGDSSKKDSIHLEKSHLKKMPGIVERSPHTIRVKFIS